MREPKRSAGIRSPRTVTAVLLILLFVHACLLAINGWLQSPTFDEPGHLLAGLHQWHTGDFSLYRVNPPLVRLVASFPTMWVGHQEDWSGYYEYAGARPVFDMAERFIALNGWRSMLYFRMARWACIPFSLFGLWVCFAWARDLYGNASGLLASTLWCFSPLVLGQASVIVPDGHATSLGLAACYTFWRWLQRPTWNQAALTGLVLGLAELSKTTMILFYPLWPVLWFVYRWRERSEMIGTRWRDEAGMLVLSMAVGVYVVNLGYLGEGCFTPLTDFAFVSQMFSGNEDTKRTGDNRFRDSWLGEVPVPLPRNYVIGIDVQQRDFEDSFRPSYLRGQYQSRGWWYYYAYAILVKAPLGTLGLFFLTMATTLFQHGRKTRRRDEFILLTPAIFIFVVASSKSGFSHHSRYILPCVPFVFVWISTLAAHARTGPVTVAAIWKRPHLLANVGGKRCRSSMTGLLAGVLLVWAIVSSLAILPHSLSYFNELAGGPRNGAEHLLNSNLDWGQDLLFLQRWIETRQAEQAEPVYLACYSYYNPFDMSIERVEPWPFDQEVVVQPSMIPNGDYAISVNLLYEYPWHVTDRDGQRYFIDHRPLAHLRTLKPIGTAGYSIRIYSAQQLKESYAAPEAPNLGKKGGDGGRLTGTRPG